MRGVVLATDRRVVNSSELHRFSDNEERWWFRFAYDGEIVQVCLAGSSECPDPAWLELAERVTAQVDEFVAEARLYLRAFVNPETITGPCGVKCWGEWDLDSMEFGPSQDLRPNRLQPFEMAFALPEDRYGVWTVRFSRSRGPEFRFYPDQFRRSQV